MANKPFKQKQKFKKKPGDKQRPHEFKKPVPRASVWGMHAVTEAWLNPERKIKALYITEDVLRTFGEIMEQAKGLDRPEPQIMNKSNIDKLVSQGAVHQGIALKTDPLEEVFIQDLIVKASNKDKAVILMLDQVTDPHNVGAILRSASAFGADGVIMQRKHAPELIGVLAKTASGAVEHIPVAYEINLSDSLDKLHENGFFSFGLDERGEDDIRALDVPAKTVIVLGAEGKGLRPKIKEHCSKLVRLPTQGAIQSLNVSNAAAVTLFAVSK